MEHQSFDGWKSSKVIHAPSEDIVRTFPQHQIYYDGTHFMQTRSGPNWQGGVLTLATCKHYMRTSNVEFLGTWLAGFTPKTGCGDNYLLFLARVCKVFDSNYDMGTFLNANFRDAWNAKLTTQHQFGDVYVPKRKLTDRTKYNTKNYYIPHGHVRMEIDKKHGVPKWTKDINYEAKGRRPVCFMFDNVQMFKRPVFVATRPLYRSGYRGIIRDLVDGVEKI